MTSPSLGRTNRLSSPAERRTTQTYTHCGHCIVHTHTYMHTHMPGSSQRGILQALVLTVTITTTRCQTGRCLLTGSTTAAVHYQISTLTENTTSSIRAALLQGWASGPKPQKRQVSLYQHLSRAQNTGRRLWQQQQLLHYRQQCCTGLPIQTQVRKEGGDASPSSPALFRSTVERHSPHRKLCLSTYGNLQAPKSVTMLVSKQSLWQAACQKHIRLHVQN